MRKLLMVSIIMVVWPDSSNVNANLQALEDNVDGEYEFILVNNGAGDLDLPGIPYVIANEQPASLARAMNQGAYAAKGDVLLFMSPAVEVESLRLSEINAAFMDRGVGCVGPSLMTMNGGEGFVDGRQTSYIEGWFNAIRRAAWEDVGEFDETFDPRSSEDRDWGYRATLRGWELRQIDLRVTHHDKGIDSSAIDAGWREWRRKFARDSPKRMVTICCAPPGDTVMSLAAIGGLARRFPNGHITAICRDECQAIYRNHPWIHDVWPESAVTESMIKEHRFDLAVELYEQKPHEVPQPWLGRVQAVDRFGWADRSQHEPQPVDRLLTTAPYHTMDVMAMIAGVEAVPPRVFPTDEDRQWARNALEPLANERRLIGLHLEGGWKSKRWPGAAVERVLDTLLLRGGVVMIGTGESEQSVNLQKSTSLYGPATDLRGQTSLGQMMAVCEQLDVMVSTDSAPAHIASACKTPVVEVWGTTRPQNYGVRSGPVRHVRASVECSPCNTGDCCMSELLCATKLDPSLIIDAVASITAERKV